MRKKPDLVNLKTFLNRHQAEIIKGILLSEGIEAIVSLDDTGGQLPNVTLISGGVRLLVRAEDLAKAQEILKGRIEE